MTQELTLRTPKDITKEGFTALQELKLLITRRPESEKLVINGKQYLYFADWQLLGAFFGITSRVIETREITKDVPSGNGNISLIETIGFHARAVAIKDGKEVSAAEAECLREEKNWGAKPRFQLLSMAQTRACAKALRNCLQWIVRLPKSDFSEEVAEEITDNQRLI